jgi:CDP-diacylglycerol--serine O-phosphatidyltransferase
MERRRRIRKAKRNPEQPRKGVYLLPNLFTTASLFVGFYSLVAASQGHWQEAGLAIFISAILDGLDGKVARMTKSTSQFGVEYDSLADVVAFGAAPAFLVHQWALSSFGRLGWVAAALFAVCGALRLARFNIQVGTKDPRFFVGLPIPAAASILAAVVVGLDYFEVASQRSALVVLVLVYVLSFLMVSNLPYRSLKYLSLTKVQSFNLLVAGVLVFSLLAYRPIPMGLIILTAYLSSGPAVALYHYWKKRRTPAPEVQAEQPPEQEKTPETGH